MTYIAGTGTYKLVHTKRILVHFNVVADTVWTSRCTPSDIENWSHLVPANSNQLNYVKRWQGQNFLSATERFLKNRLHEKNCRCNMRLMALLPLFLFLRRFDDICDLSLNRRTAAWNLFFNRTSNDDFPLIQRIVTACFIPRQRIFSSGENKGDAPRRNWIKLQNEISLSVAQIYFPPNHWIPI